MTRTVAWTIAGLLSLFAAPASASELRVGFATADITPDITARPVYLAGFGHNRKASEIHSRLAVRVVVLHNGTRKIAIASADVVGLFLPFVERVRGRLSGFDYVLVTATHNHHGPDTMGLWGPHPLQSGVDNEYMKLLEDRIVEAIRQAESGLQPVEVSLGTSPAPELLHDSRDPQVKHDLLSVLRFRDPASNRTVGLIVQWNCHPETLASKSPRLSADYVATTVARLEKAHNCRVVYLTGTVGGLMTSMHVDVRDTSGQRLAEGSVEKTERYGELLAEASGRALSGATKIALSPFVIRTKSLILPVDNPMYRVAKSAGVLDRAMEPWAGDPYAAPRKLDRLEGRPAVRTEVGHLRLGQLDVAVIPGEIYPELVVGGVPDPAPAGADFSDAPIEPVVYHQMIGRYKMIVGLGNDEIGYILPRRQWDEKPPYTFGRTKPPYGEINSLGPETGPLLLEAFRSLARDR